jgi:hypothetical protein
MPCETCPLASDLARLLRDAPWKFPEQRARAARLAADLSGVAGGGAARIEQVSRAGRLLSEIGLSVGR